MKHDYTIDIYGNGVDELIKGVQEYKEWLNRKSHELAERLASIGATQANLGFASALYDGNQDYEVSVEPVSETEYIVRANGETVLFVEFGAGITYGYGHPEAGTNGMGPGTYPGKGHWDDPNGWYIPKEHGGGHTYGNPPNAPMYNAVKTLEQQIQGIIREVFSD